MISLTSHNSSTFQNIIFHTEINVLHLWEFNTQQYRNKFIVIFKHYLAAWNNDCSRFRVRDTLFRDNYFDPEGVPWIEVSLSFSSVLTLFAVAVKFVSCEIFCYVVVSCSSFLSGNEILSKIIVSSSFLFPPFAAKFSQYLLNGELAPRVQKLWHGSYHTVFKACFCFSLF